MLVLSRKKDQKVVIPDLGITITICKIFDEKVKIGFEAPPEIKILREELLKSEDAHDV